MSSNTNNEDFQLSEVFNVKGKVSKRRRQQTVQHCGNQS